MFEAKNISVQFGAKKILDEVTLEINPGEVVALLGANGAGKSTLLKTFCGEVKLKSGEVFLENRRLETWDYHELARKRAVLSQHSTLAFPFTAREVALLGRNPHIRGRESKKDLEIINDALKLVEAEHLAGQSFPTLSGGEQQRVHLARVLAQIWEKPENSPRYLFLDEPTSSLDLSHQHLTLQIAQKLSRENTGVIVVLHDLNLAANYADRICLMKNGKFFREGIPAEILTAPNIKAVFDFNVSILEHNNLPLVVPQTTNYYLT
jgi:iron complex transport system ATP-binding protein